MEWPLRGLLPRRGSLGRDAGEAGVVSTHSFPVTPLLQRPGLVCIPSFDSSVGPCCVSCLSPGGPTWPDPLCLYLGLSGPPVSTARLSLSDPGPKSQRSPPWKRDAGPREGRMPRVCVCVCVCVHARSLARPLGTSWTVSHQAPLSMGFSRQEYWSGVPFPSPGDLPDPGIELTSLASPAVAGRVFTS